MIIRIDTIGDVEVHSADKKKKKALVKSTDDFMPALMMGAVGAFNVSFYVYNRMAEVIYTQTVYPDVLFHLVKSITAALQWKDKETKFVAVFKDFYVYADHDKQDFVITFWTDSETHAKLAMTRDDMESLCKKISLRIEPLYGELVQIDHN